MWREKTGYVYLIEYNGFYKIGITEQSLRKRLSGFQFPTEPELLCAVSVPFFKKLEKFLHDYFSKYSVRNEWFSFGTIENAKKLFNEGVSLYNSQYLWKLSIPNGFMNRVIYPDIEVALYVPGEILLIKHADEVFAPLFYERAKNSDTFTLVEGWVVLTFSEILDITDNLEGALQRLSESDLVDLLDYALNSGKYAKHVSIIERAE